MTSGAAQNYSNSLDNAVKSNWRKSFNDSSSFVHSMDQTTRTQLTAAMNAGGSLGVVSGSGSGQVSVIGTDGEKVNFNVSESTANAFARDQARVRSQSIQETFGDSQGLDYLQNVSKQIGASQSYSFLEDARQVEAATESYGTNMQTAFVRDYAKQQFGDESPENIRKAIGALAHISQSDPQAMNRMVGGFVSGDGYGWGRTDNQVNNAMNAMKNGTHDDAILKGGVDHTTNAAGQKASGVTPGGFVPPDPRGLRDPDSATGTDKANHLKNLNRHEESGDGRIRTTATGMAKEGVGKVFGGVVDSQGDRPTKDGYFDYTSTTRRVGDSPPVGPIPKGSKSTLK
jgi:conjugal transfer mating pair stabilization protein TraG